MTRSRQLWYLIILSALTAVAQYVMQGSLATGHNPTAFVAPFWLADYALWGLRALIEAWVIVYLFQTDARSRWQSAALTIFEVALIVLIAATLGPALRAVGLGLTMPQSLDATAYWLWCFGIAAYTSLMMAAAGTAYRIQPDGIKPELTPPAVVCEWCGRECGSKQALSGHKRFCKMRPKEKANA